jgi:hypothetical protein
MDFCPLLRKLVNVNSTAAQGCGFAFITYVNIRCWQLLPSNMQSGIKCDVGFVVSSCGNFCDFVMQL